MCVLTVTGVVPLAAAGEADAPGLPDAATAAQIYTVGDLGYLDPADPVTPFRDPDARVEVVPPRGWMASPPTSLDRSTDEDTYEVARFQLSLRDPALYAQPLPVTSGLLADAGAVLSLSIGREGGALIGLDLDSLDAGAVRHAPGVTFVDGEGVYDGVVTLTRIAVARDTDRALVVRAFMRSVDRDVLGPILLDAIASAKLDPAGPNGPRYVAPAPPPAPAAPEEAQAASEPPDPSSEIRGEIVARASSMLGTPYVWGGNSPGRGMDCSAYVSAAWGVARYTTDSIWNVAVPIAKGELLPGDAMDLEMWRDPSGYGHIRLFDAWANEAHTLVWVYEETPPRAIHRVIAYDAAYRPIRLGGLSGSGVAPLVPAPAAMPVPRLGAGAPAPTRRPSTARPTWHPATWTPRPTPIETHRPWPTPTPRPTAPPTRTPTPRPTPTVHSTALPATARPRRTPAPTRR